MAKEKKVTEQNEAPAKTGAKAKKPENPNKKPNVFVRFGRFLRESFREMKKVIWPTGKQTMKNSAVVLVSIVVVALILAVLDYGYSNGVFELQQLFQWLVPVLG